MQPGEKIKSSKRNRHKQFIKTHHLSSFGILNRNSFEIINSGDRPVNKEENESKLSKFSDWSMPDQPLGYIRCKNHDFF
jgi:hypothetical protein